MITRDIFQEFQQLKKEYPIVTVLGPRQAGKTTLAKLACPDYEYVNLESPETRAFAQADPQAFLSQLSDHVILDEIQRIPELLSYIQVVVDEHHREGHFVLTGSHQLELRQAISQSLAGRAAILTLLPLSIHELKNENLGFSRASEYIYHGFLPRVYDKQQRPGVAYSNYYQTYVERDVRQLINLKDVALFERFLKLLAGRVGQLLDYNSLANDVGTSSKTIKSWLSILEASFLIFKLPPFYENFGKRLTKSPKYYFLETGLLCFLLGIQSADQVERDPLVGNLFENLVLLECVKAQLHRGNLPNLYFFRDSNGLEVDILWQKGRQLIPIEVKSSATYHPSLIKGLKRFQKVLYCNQQYLVSAGDVGAISEGVNFARFDTVHEIFS